MCSRIILLPVVPAILPCIEPFAGGNIDCSEIGVASESACGAAFLLRPVVEVVGRFTVVPA